jgi:NADH dehydrogenase
VNNHVTPHVVIVGGGFAGLACARKLAKSDNVRVTVIDKNNYQGPIAFSAWVGVQGFGSKR